MHGIWIRCGRDIGSVSPAFAKQFTLKKPIQRATARASAMGLYKLMINGRKVGNALLTPGATSYAHRVLYQEYDATDLLKDGENRIEIIGGNHLFLIIPSDEYASVTVNRLKLGSDGFTGIADEVLYESETGEPFLLRCNEYDFAMDSEILIVETDGDEYGWYPDVLPSGRIFAPQVEDAVYFDLTVYEGE